ncbi:MAG TPA: hypothetical protein VLG72_04280, partial [Nitrospirota bacterium]|nr:hypothetical protein [Nitrospirota bacterium]
MKKLPHIIVILCIALLCPAAVFPQEPKSKNTTLGIISVPLANVHEEPLPKSSLVTQVLMADEVRIL